MAGSMILRASEVDSGSIDFTEALNPPDLANPLDNAFIQSGGLPREKLLAFLTDVQYEPTWRQQADIDVDYYDGHQLTQETLSLMQQRGLPPLIINIIQPTVNNVLGLEAKTRSDVEVTFDDEESEEVAIALNKKMNDAQREAKIDRATSDAYAGQVKAGLGWVEVSDNNNPMQYRYRVNSVHRREIWWDWRDTDPSLDKARYLLRKAWHDDDMLEMFLPQYKGLLGNNGGGGIDGFAAVAQNVGANSDLDFSTEFARGISMEQAEWRDTERRRSVIYECWYRVWQRGYVVRLPNDKVVEVDPQNHEHMAAVAAGVVMPMPAFWPKMRQSIWIGPHRIFDNWSPLPHQSFPYVPFWGFREDLNAMPYGLIRAMISPQDEINNRRARMAALLSARRVQIDEDALLQTHNTHQQVANSASSHNHYIILNPNRKNQDGIRIDTNMDLSVAQLQVLQESKAEIHEVSGIFTAQQGEAPSGMSGYAINSLVEQGTTTLAEIGDNYRFARTRVHELVLEHLKRDSTMPHQVVVGDGKQRKTISLNQPAPEGVRLINDVKMSTARVVLQDVPSTPGYRQQQFMMLTEMVKGLPPEVGQFVIDFVIEASDIPERKKIAARVRKALNLPAPGDEGQEQELPPEVQAMIQQSQQAMQEQQLVIQDLSEKLAKATNALATEDAKHQHRMAELDGEAKLAGIKHRTQMVGAGVVPEDEVKPLLDQFEADITGRLEQLASVVQEVAATVSQPKRTVVKDHGNGTFEVVQGV